MKLTLEEFGYLGLCLQGFFFGLYSAIFAMYLQYHTSKNDTDRTKNILFYALCILYVLCFAGIIIDMVSSITEITEAQSIYYLNVTTTIVPGFCNFIAQSILIYRCWIVWGRNFCVVIIPLILAFIFLATWVVGSTGSIYTSSGRLFASDWEHTLMVISFTISMVLNALVMGLIVLKIFKVFWEVKAASSEQNLPGGVTGGNKLRSIIFILIESGMVLFSIQLARLMISIVATTIAYQAYFFISVLHKMFNGITPTIILVRVSMGLSFYDEDSMVEAAASLCFAPDHSNPIPDSELGSINHESRDISIRLSEEIQMVEK